MSPSPRIFNSKGFLLTRLLEQAAIYYSRMEGEKSDMIVKMIYVNINEYEGVNANAKNSRDSCRLHINIACDDLLLFLEWN
jgi:hypothetical protein